MPQPLWTPPLFGWQYPIEWSTEYPGQAQALGLPPGADIWWALQQRLWVATFDHREQNLTLHGPFVGSHTLIRERHARLDVLVRRFEKRLAALRASLDAFSRPLPS